MHFKKPNFGKTLSEKVHFLLLLNINLNLVSQITMKRRSLLYIVNFLLPVLFFLCLDLASFMISDYGGEKLSFKVTVLLAITVLQLILNEILPSSSDRVPLIGRINLLLLCGKRDLTSFILSCLILFSRLLHRDFCSDDAQPPGDDFRDVSETEKLPRYRERRMHDPRIYQVQQRQLSQLLHR